MVQTEFNEAFRRFQAARVMARIDIDSAYELSPEMFTPTSGTTSVGEQTQLGYADLVYLKTLAARRRHDEAFVSLSAGTLLNLIHQDFFSWSSESELVTVQSGEIVEPKDDLQAVVDYARRHGLQEVADRLVDLARLPVGDDEMPLQAGAARNFAEYCVARQKSCRPLMTVTPAGDLDATWKGADGESVTMRFFSDGRVWVAYKLSKERGSFERAAADLQDSKLRFRIPDWA